MSYNRPTSLALALVEASVKAPNKNWIKRTVIDRATHTTTGVVKERDNNHVSYKTAKACQLI